MERIRAQAFQTDWSAQIISKASIGDLDEKAIERAKELFAVKNPKLKTKSLLGIQLHF